MERTSTFKNGQIKRTKALKFLALSLLLLYVLVLTVSFFSSKVLFNVWFSLGLGLSAVYQITRGIFFFLDSNLLFGGIALCFSIVSVLNFYFNFAYFVELYVLCFALPFLVVYFIFRQNFYIISFAFACLEVLLLVINKFYLNNTIFLLLQALVFVAIFVFLYLAIAIKRKR